MSSAAGNARGCPVTNSRSCPDELPSPISAPATTQSSSAWSRLNVTSTLALSLAIVLSLAHPSTATPIDPDDDASRTFTSPSLLSSPPRIKRADDPAADSNNQGESATNVVFIAVPVAVGSLFLVAVLVMTLRRRPGWRKALVHIFSQSALAPLPEERAMESTNNTPVATGAGVGGREQTEAERERAQVLADARRNQRAERVRRQGSQRSVKSLPVYRQDLQDDEMVLVKGDDNLEDSDSPRNSRDLGDRPRGTRATADEDPTFDPPASASLLDRAGGPSNQDDTVPSSPESPRIDLMPISAPPTATRFDQRSSSISTFDTYGRDSVDGGRTRSSTDGGSHADLINHGWGEAPSYEAQSFNDGGVETLGAGRSSVTPAALEDGSASRPRRASGFSRFFNRTSSHQQPPTSYPPDAPPTSSSGSRPTHQPAASGSSSSGLNFMPFGNSSASLLHPVSTRRSSDARDRLTSASTLSISAPLTDTLVKSTFTTPTKGLTPSQMKFISSTENLGKYAVPYGPSSSRRSMDARRRSGEEEAPPPSFEDASDASPASRIDGLPPTSSTSPSPVVPTSPLPPITDTAAPAAAPTAATDAVTSAARPSVVVDSRPDASAESDSAPASQIDNSSPSVATDEAPSLEVIPATPKTPPNGTSNSLA